MRGISGQAEEIVVCQYGPCSTDLIYENSKGSIVYL